MPCSASFTSTVQEAGVILDERQEDVSWKLILSVHEDLTAKNSISFSLHN